MIVCVCKAIRSNQLNELLEEQPEASFETVQKSCGAGSDCGSCVERIKKILEKSSGPQLAKAN